MTYKRIMWAAGAAALTVLLSGCIKLDMEVTVHSNDTISGSVVTAVSKQVAELAGGEAGIRDQIRQSMTEAEVPAGVELSDYTDDRFVGIQASFDNISLQEFNSSPGSAASDVLIRHEADKFIVDATLPLSGEEFGAGELGPLAGTGEIKIAVTFPGRVLSHNGELSGTTVTWIGTLGEDLVMQAESEETGADLGGGGSTGLWIGIAALVAAALAGLFFFLRSRSTGTPAVVTPGPDGTTGTIADYDPARITAGGEASAADPVWAEAPIETTATLPEYHDETVAEPAPAAPSAPAVGGEPATSGPAGAGASEPGVGGHPSHPATNAVLEQLDSDVTPASGQPTATEPSDQPTREG